MFARYSDLDKRGRWPIGSGEIAENRSAQFWRRTNFRGCTRGAVADMPKRSIRHATKLHKAREIHQSK